MIAGRILDQGHSFILFRRRWYQGNARMGFFGIKSDGPSYEVDTFRCELCGTLESIAAKK
jgi:hypothetical protein